ncbi:MULTISPECIES: penicillin-binding transpeptidase domain-containing protein [unclassified Sedimentibacter]|uniref:penicillin-binding transpeptidase domain-containing protein n=1 Tax=unclassified Sedimentibacter TaxID=2649220 RepID=UPI0027E1B02C|nr:penicillin-binding transpeptidase domain-containing protein [Sedimentibacter sp. MB35-C1]WMJ75887.1 penicillin-binding transpeptidase domain-containing protein [Sedimentibacter sp. MB35-C1]
MSLQKFFKNRYNILYMIILFLLCVLGFRMAVLTIVEGEEYRAVADIKKIKDIPVKAPRGKIYDKNGVILADNVSSFTVQMYTDEIDAENFNDISYILAEIFEENGEKPIDEFPIELDTFDYIDESKEANKTSDDAADSASYITAEETVINAVKNNINEWLNYRTLIYGKEFNPKQRALDTILRYKDIPVKLENDQFIFYFPEEKSEESDGGNSEITVVEQTDATQKEDETQIIEGEQDPVKRWLEENDFDKSLSAEQLIAELLAKNNKYLTRLFSNSKIRKLSFDFINSNGLGSNIKLVEYAFVQDENYKNIKRSLNANHEGITQDSSAKDDFVLLTMTYSLESLLQSVYETETGKVAPGEVLIERLKEIYPDLPVMFVEESGSGSYQYTDEQLKNKYLDQHNLEQDTQPYDFVKQISFKNYDVLQNFITDESIKYYAQSELLKHENPSISISDWEYTPIRDKRNWIQKNVEIDSKEELNYSAEEVFLMLRKTLKIDSSINDYDMRNMMVIRERYNKTSYLSYHPVDICYGISEKSVAMISERSHELTGINVEIEPLRVYPQNDIAAHAIGYLGKIAQDYEVQEYVVEKGYSPDDIIGKTGLEEKFEEYLRGTKGKKTVEVNNVGRTIRSVSSEAPEPGDNIYLTLDSRLQKTAQDVLKKGLEQIQIGGTFESEWGDFDFKDKYENAKSGALVVLDVNTGEVLAMANYPSYDLNMFATGISQDDWNGLLNDSKNPLAPRPLYNIAMLTAIQPGSTFKMITSLAALEKGVDPNTTVYCSGTMEVGDRYFSCWIYNMFGGAHGSQNMYQAIMNSCNFYFYTTMLGENLATHQKHTVKVSAEEIIEMAKKFGLDSKTGIEIDIPQEASGGVPSIDGKKINIRVYLRMFLEANIEKYLETGYKIEAGMKNEIVEEIVSWVDRDEPMTRGEVYEGLKALRLNPEKTNDYNVPLVDIIKYSYLNQAVWNVGDNLNISIGQGNNAYTVMQMANYIASIANGGYRNNVSIIKEIKTYDRKNTDYVPQREAEPIGLSDYSYLDVVKEGMRLVSLDDSAKPYSSFPVEVGSKTGTAQNQGINPDTGEPYDDFAWYVAFAPYDDPQIAVACVLFEGGSGRYPTPIVREVIGEYLKLNNEEPQTEE